MVSEEPFMKKLKDKGIIDMFKIRGSIGEIGDDNAGARWAYMNQWAVTSKVHMTLTDGESPFQGYKESVIASPDLKWATVSKKNLGFDYAFLHGMFAGSFDWFRDDRKDIFVSGGNRSVPSYYGAGTVPDINKGEIKNTGFEFEVRFNFNRVERAVIDIVEEQALTDKPVPQEQLQSDPNRGLAALVAALILLYFI